MTKLFSFKEFLFEAEKSSESAYSCFRAGASETPIGDKLGAQMGIKANKKYEITLSGGMPSLFSFLAEGGKLTDFGKSNKAGSVKEVGDAKGDFLKIGDSEISKKGEFTFLKSDDKPNLKIEASGNGVLVLSRMAEALRDFKEVDGLFLKDLSNYSLSFSLGTSKEDEDARGYLYYAYVDSKDMGIILQQALFSAIQIPLILGFAAQQKNVSIQNFEKIFSPIFSTKSGNALISSAVDFTKKNFNLVKEKGPEAYTEVVNEYLNKWKNGLVNVFNFYVNPKQENFGSIYAEAAKSVKEDTKKYFTLVDNQSLQKSFMNNPQSNEKYRNFLFTGSREGLGVYTTKESDSLVMSAKSKCADLLKTNVIPSGMSEKSSPILEKINEKTVEKAKGEKELPFKGTGFFATAIQGKLQSEPGAELTGSFARLTKEKQAEGQFRKS